MTVVEADRIAAVLDYLARKLSKWPEWEDEAEHCASALEDLGFLLAELARKDEALRAADSALAACGCVWSGGCRTQKVPEPCSVCAARDRIAAALGEQP